MKEAFLSLVLPVFPRSETGLFSLRENLNRTGSSWVTPRSLEFSSAVTICSPVFLALQPSPTLPMCPVHTAGLLSQCPHQQSSFPIGLWLLEEPNLLGWVLTTHPTPKLSSLQGWVLTAMKILLQSKETSRDTGPHQNHWSCGKRSFSTGG